MTKYFIKQSLIVFCFIVLWFKAYPYSVFGETGYIDKKYIPLQPSMSKFYLSIYCYDAFTLRAVDCAFTYKIIGLKSSQEAGDNNGGHAHNYDTHPLIEPPEGTIEVNRADSDSSKLGVKGGTGWTDFDAAATTHPLPQAAGKIMAETTV